MARKRMFANGEMGTNPEMAHPMYKKMARDIMAKKQSGYAEGGQVKQDKWFTGDADEAAAKREAWKEKWAAMSKGASGRTDSGNSKEGVGSKLKSMLGFAHGGEVESPESWEDGEDDMMEDIAEANDTQFAYGPDGMDEESKPNLAKIINGMRMRKMNKGGYC